MKYNCPIISTGVIYIKEKFKWALTPANVAAIGAIDDFYDLYVSIQEIYEEQREQFVATHGDRRILWPTALDDLCRKHVRKACEPVMNKYLSVFSDKYSRIFANAYGFSSFSFYNIIHNHPLSLKMQYISFSHFLVELQFAVTRIIHNWKTQTQPKYAFERLCREINDHVLVYVQQNTVVETLPDNNAKPITEAVLYIYENLASTYCCINKHIVKEASFVADFATGSGKIALPVHYCSKCEKFFIGKITLQLFEKNYGKLLVKTRKLTDEENAFSSFNAESPLYQLGYNVSDNRTDAERQQLLVVLLRKKKITYLDIEKYIELNIRVHSHKPEAVVKWKRDLKFIGDYVLHAQSK